jgi:hypothetical protein
MVPPPNPLIDSVIPNNQTGYQVNYSLTNQAQAQAQQNLLNANLAPNPYIQNQAPVYYNQPYQMPPANPINNSNQNYEVLNSNNSPIKQQNNGLYPNANVYPPYPQNPQPINNQGNAIVAIRHTSTN